MDILLAPISTEDPAVLSWSTAAAITLIARHRLADEEPAADEDDEDWDDDDLDDDDWDEDDDDDWDDDDEDEPANLVTITQSPVVARS